MHRMVKWAAPVVALGLMLGLGVTKAVAEDAKGSVSGTVTGADGKPAAGVTVRVVNAPVKGEKKAAEAGAEKPKHAPPVAEGKTDDSGKFELKDIPAGAYVVQAGNKAAGMGREKVTVTAGGNAEVSITLKAAGEKPAAAEGHKKHGKKAESN